MGCGFIALLRGTWEATRRVSLPGLVSLLMLIIAVPSFAAGDLSLFGPKRYERVQGKPWLFTDTFNGCANAGGQALLRVQNGSGKDTSLSSAVIAVNGTPVLAEADFKNQTPALERSIALKPGINTLTVQLKSGGQKETPFLVVTIVGLGCDSTPPAISAAFPVDGALLNIARPTIGAAYADESGGAGIDLSSVRITLDGSDLTPSCTVAASAVTCLPGFDLREGAHNVSLTVADRLQNPATLSWRFSTDTVPPIAIITNPAGDQYLSSRTVTVSGSIDDPKATVSVNGKEAVISGPLFSVADVPLTEGANTLTVVAVDPAGNRSESAIPVSVDTSLPVVTVTAPVNGSFTALTPVVVSGSVGEPPVAVTVNGRAAAIDGQNFSLADFSLAEGLNTLTVEAEDRAGNSGTAIVTVTLDTVNPRIAVASPANGTLTRNPSLSVSGSVSEQVVSLTVNGTAVPVAPDLTFTADVLLSEGVNAVALAAIDRAGNRGEAVLSVTLDSSPPLAPTLEALTTPTNQPAIRVAGSAEPLSSLSLYNGDERVATVVVPADGRFDFPGTILHEGENAFSATALDPAGNESARSAPVTVVLDTVVPMVGITAPVDQATINTPVVTVRGTGADPTAAVTVNGRPAVVDGAGWILEDFTLQEGSNTLLAEARDPAGNKGTAVVTVTLDTIPPEVTIAAPTAGLRVNTPQLTVSGSVSEEVATTVVNGVAATVAEDLTFTCTVTLQEGENGITAVADDLAGNRTSAATTVILDTIPPVVTITAPTGSALVNVKQLQVSGTISEPVALLTVNGLPATVTGTTFSATVNLDEGANTITVLAVDLAGNRGSAAIAVTVDSTPPSLPTLNTLPWLTPTPETVIRGTAEPGSVITLYAGGTKLGQVTADTDGTFVFTRITLPEGESIFTVVARDGAGNDSQLSEPVHEILDTRAPAVAITSPVDGSILITPTVTVSGSIDDLTANVTVNGRSAVVNDTGWTVAGVPLQEGGNSILAEARDAAGNRSTATTSVTLDTQPPVITVTTPAADAVVNTPQLTVTGSVDEQVAVTTVNGTPATVAWDPASGVTRLTAAITLVPGHNSITVAATDLAGNSATRTQAVTLDNVPPVVTISAPLSGRVTGTAQIDVSGAISKTGASATVNGAPITVTGQTFGFTYTLGEGDNTITVEAVDQAGNRGSAAVGVILDTQAPVLSLQAPAMANAGANVAITVSATDNRSVTLAELTADGVPIWSGGSAATVNEAVSYRLAPSLDAGSEVVIRGRGVDAAGNEGSAVARIGITQAAMGPGYLQGKVLDDTRGLRLEGATVTVVPAAGEAISLTSAADGGYFTESAAGVARLRVAKAGYTAVERQQPVMPEQQGMVLDARLTAVSAQQHLLDTAGGSVLLPLANSTASHPIELAVPAGALSAPADLRLTPVSNQGLAGLLPSGWSPLAAVQIDLLDPVAGTPLAMDLASPATLTLPLPAATVTDPPIQPLLVQYDPDVHRWLARGAATPAADGLSAVAMIAAAGQYALVLADPASAPATLPEPGTPPAAAATVPLDYDAVAASGKVVPQASPPASGLRAAGELVLVARDGAAATPQFFSGTLLAGRITEQFDLKSGDRVEPAVASQDLVLYRLPCATNIAAGALDVASGAGLRTTFPVAPSREFTIVDLLMGKVGVEIVRPAASAGGVMVGPDGGRLVDADGNILEIPQGALAQATPVSSKNAVAASGAVGSDFTLVKAVEINLTRQTLALGATLTVVAPAGLDPALPLLVARQVDVKGTTRLKLVGAARLSGSLLSSNVSLPGVLLPGITTSGVYYFIQARGPVGFVGGTVTDAGSVPFAGALVKSDTGSLVDLTSGAGRYLLALPVGGFTVTALDLAKNDTGSAAGTLATPNQTLAVDLVIRMVPPRVSAISPAAGAANVQPNVPVTVTFSKAMDKSTITTASLRLATATGTAVSGVLSFNVDATAVSFYPAAALQSETAYTVTVAGTVRDLQGYPLGQDVVAGFTVRKTTPPPMPAAGAITGSFPDADGFVTVTGTQGSAEPGNTVLLINDTTGEIVSLSPASSGAFTGKIRAQLGDQIKVVLMDHSGNQTTVSYLTFKSDDGRYLVTAKGGKVEGDGGSQLDIPEGALVGPTVLKIIPVMEADLPSPIQTPGKFLGAVTIDSGGIGFRKKVDISLPLPVGFDPATPVFLTRPGEVTGADGNVEKVYEIIDSTKVVNGRITTACWPFDGVLAAGTYAFTAFPELTVGIISGYTYQEMNGQSGYQPTADGSVEIPIIDAAGNKIYQFDRPVRGAVVRSAQAWNYVSYSRSNGFYSAFTDYYGNIGTSGCRDYSMVAIHPITMQRASISGNACTPPYNVEKLNFRLADKDTIPPDRSAPIINATLQVVPGQDADKRIIAGTAPVGTRIKLPISVIDQVMGSTTLTVKYKEPGASTSLDTPIYLTPPVTPAPHGYLLEEQAFLYLYDYEPSFNSDSSLNYFTPSLPGYYSFFIEATDAAGNRSTRTLKLTAVQSNAKLITAVDGPPMVLSVLPEDGSGDVAVTTQVVATFSEPVQFVEDNFKLYDLGSTSGNSEVPATVVVGTDGGRVQAVLIPKGNLRYDREYRVVLGTSITDVESNPNHGGSTLPLEQETSTTFRTKKPTAYDLPEDEQFTGGRDVDVYSFIDEDNEPTTYAYVMAGDKGWRIVDVTDPANAAVVYTASPTCTGSEEDCRLVSSAVNFRSVAVHPENTTGLMAMTENIVWPDGNQYGYLRIYDISSEPDRPTIIGKEKLAEAMSGIPGRLALYGDYAVISTAGAGIQVVNLKEAIRLNNRPADGSSIVGVLDTIGQGFGSPNDLAIINERNAVFTTNPGYLLTVDLNLPTADQGAASDAPVLPLVISAYHPDSPALTNFTRVGAVGGFAYTAEDGEEKTINLAVTGSTQGRINTVDLTDPSNPHIIGTADNPSPAYARDITISKEYGLAIVYTLNTVQIYDIKDPTHPHLLNEILTTDVDGVSVSLAGSLAIVEKGGWLYLANQDKGLVSLDLRFAPECVGGEACNYGVERVYQLGQFETATTSDNYTDVYRVVEFKVDTASRVVAQLLDHSGQKKLEIVPEQPLGSGTYNFVVDYDTVSRAGIGSGNAPGYTIRVVITPNDGTAQKKIDFNGRISERPDGVMLGSTIVHDVMIQNGSLNLSRQDFAFNGRGPQLAFGRAYSNQGSGLRHRPLGNGWTHTLDFRLKPVSTDAYLPGGHLPQWVIDKQGSFYDPASVNVGTEWKTLIVNNATFRKMDFDGWVADRGHHGTLEELLNSAGKVIGYVFTAKDGTRYTYDSPAIEKNKTAEPTPVKTIEDRNGLKLTFTYTPAGHLDKVADDSGRTCSFAYDYMTRLCDPDPTRLMAVSCSGDMELRFTYDANGNLHSASRGDRVETYGYAREAGIEKGDFNLVSTRYDGNAAYGYEYYGPGDVANIVPYTKPQDVISSVILPPASSSGSATARVDFTYSTSGNTRTVTDALYNSTTYILNAYGNPLIIAEPLGRTIKMTWSIDSSDNGKTGGKPDNQMLSREDGNNYKTTFEYDAHGNVVKETDPLGKSIDTTWNAKFSLPLYRKDRNGKEQNWDYDPKGNLTFFTDGEHQQTQYRYDLDNGDRKAMIDARGTTTSYGYDQWGNLSTTTVSTPDGDVVTSQEHDPRGRLTSVTDPNGNKTLYTYDDLDYATSVSLPEHVASTHPQGGYDLPAGSSAAKKTTYDPIGNLLEETDRTGLKLEYGYTPRNQVRSIKRSGPGLVEATKTFGYDDNGNLTSESDWKGIATTTHHNYDALNRRDWTTNRLGYTMKMGYDLNDNLTSETDFEERVTTHEYDKLNRRTLTVQPVLPGQSLPGTLKYTYYNEADPKTNLKTEEDQEGHVTTYEYNGRYQRTKRTDARQKVHVWDYDEVGNLKTELDEEGRTTTFTYDKMNRPVTVTLPVLFTNGTTLNPVITHTYDAAGNRTSTTDSRRNVTEMKYDEWNRLWKTITPADPVKYETVTELDGEGRKVRTIDGNGVIRTTLRDVLGRVSTAIDGEHNTTSYTYDANGNLETVKEPNGTVTTNHYDFEDQLDYSTETQADGILRWRDIFTRDKVGNPLTVKDFNGNITTNTFNTLNLPETVCNTVTGVYLCTETRYYKTGKVKSVKDRRGHSTTYAYDELNRQWRVTDPLGQTVETLYDGVGNVTSVKDKRGIYTLTSYNSLNLPEEVKRQGAVTTRTVTNQYDEAGNKIAEIDANGNKTTYSYSPRNLRAGATPPNVTVNASCAANASGIPRAYTYDGVGNVKTESDELGKVTTYTYDGENRRTSVEFAGETTTTAYSFFGKPTSVTRPMRNGRILKYDGFKRLVGVTEGGPVVDGAIASGLTTTYEYDDNGNQRFQHGPGGDLTEYVYDELNRTTDQIQHLSSGNLLTNYILDGEGNVIQSTDPKRQVTINVYDDINRHTDSSYPDNVSPFYTLTSTHFDYDGNNNVAKVTETKTGPDGLTINDVTDNRVYDDFDRLLDSTQRGVPVTYRYDNNGNRLLVTTPNGETNYTYDERNRLKTATLSQGTTEYCYRADNLKELTSYPNGTSERLEYFPTNRINSIVNKAGDTIFSRYDYEYDANGNRTKQVELQNGLTWTTQYGTVANGQTQRGYDNLDRLTNYTVYAGVTVTATGYTYEGYNRKTEKVISNGTLTTDKTYDYDTVNRLKSVADGVTGRTVTYAYDDNGNTVKKTDSGLTPAYADTLFVYDSRNRLVRTTQSDPNGGSVLGLYDYDAAGMRIRNRLSDRGDVDYVYDGRSVIEERNSADNSLLARYSYADKLLSLTTPQGSQYYHHDALGSTVNLTDESGNPQAGYTLSPFGQIVAQFGQSVNRHIFTGKEEDTNTGLVYFGARFYDPEVGRFITQDSYLGTSDTPPSLHRYLYAYSNPLAYIDPDGHAGYFFGGTGNHLNDTNYDGSKNIKTNVEKLYKAYEDEAFYAYGIGSGFHADGTPYEKKWHGGTGRKIMYEQITGESMNERVSFMMDNLKEQLEKNDKVVDVFAFSRGSATALEFLNRIQKEIDDKNELYKGINIRFVGLFDTVPSKRSGLFSYGNEEQVPTGEKNWLGFDKTKTIEYHFSLPKKMQFSATPVHAVSVDEQRKEFATVDLEGALQVGFRGVHADLGGGYAHSNFDWIALDYMVAQAKNAQVKFDEKELGKVERNGYEQYMLWLNSSDAARRSYAMPYDNREWFYHNNYPRKLPKNMMLHQSVDYFKIAPKNDIGGYRYIQ